MKNKIALILILIFAVMQIFTIDKIPFEESSSADIFEVEAASDEVKSLIKNNCYDCHSNQVDYPWYSNIAPVSWWLQDHIEHGIKHLNFSEWGELPRGKKEHKAEEGVEMLEEEEMPLPSYTLIHREADLSEEERTLLINWFAGIEKKYKD